MIVIWDPVVGRHRNVRGLRIVSYPNEAERFVEFTVIGNHREWPMLLPLGSFQQFNPNVSVEE